MATEFDPLFGALLGDGWFPSPAHVMRRAAIIDAFRNYPPGRLLEMGCGAGRMLVDWAAMGHAGQAVDLDATARAYAERCAEAFSVPFVVSHQVNGCDYDYLIATEVLEHVEDPASTLGEWLTHLKPGGIALITVPAFARLWGRSDEWAGHVRRFEPQELVQLVTAAGLEIELVRLYGYPIGNLLRVAGNFSSWRKMRRRPRKLLRADATYASGHDRSAENRLAPFLRSLPGRLVLKLAITAQRRFDRGHGLILIARKRRGATAANI